MQNEQAEENQVADDPEGGKTASVLIISTSCVAFVARKISAVCACPVEDEAALAEAFACGLGFPFPLKAAFFFGSLLAFAFACCDVEDLAEVEEVELERSFWPQTRFGPPSKKHPPQNWVSALQGEVGSPWACFGGPEKRSENLVGFPWVRFGPHSLWLNFLEPTQHTQLKGKRFQTNFEGGLGVWSGEGFGLIWVGGGWLGIGLPGRLGLGKGSFGAAGWRAGVPVKDWGNPRGPHHRRKTSFPHRFHIVSTSFPHRFHIVSKICPQ